MIRIAKKAANKSNFSRARLGAVITKGGKVISVGVNKYGSNRNLKHKDEFSSTIHAEEAAIIALLSPKKQHLLAGSTLYVSRVLKNGESGLAKPCETCQKLIMAVGIKKVFYTTETGVEQL